jgi:hypothetical protein
MNKKVLFVSVLTLLLFLFNSCELFEEVDNSNDFEFEMISITPGGGYEEHNSYRNHHYQFETTTEGAIIDVAAEFSEIEGKIFILNSARSVVKNSGIVSVDEKIESLELPSSGSYYIVITTDVDVKGSYTLIINSDDINNVERIYSDKHSKESNSWESAGGYSAFNSYRNAHYKLDVAKDHCYIDIVCKSQQAESKIHLLNSAYTSVKNSGYPSINEQITGYEIANKGTYYLIATADEGESGTFDMYIYSKEGAINHVTTITSSIASKSGSWSPGGGISNYSSSDNAQYKFEVKEKTYIDIIAKSEGAETKIFLLDPAGDEIKNSGYPTTYELISEFEVVNPGEYTIALTAGETDNGTFDLFVYAKSGTIGSLNAQ